mmetsp:Transcript_34314/g.38898  ORF Transcript_34314/g.38898 Transcript_34314/m.38898 type:complete len:525 (+) Transcript_34314:23-1597(+)
MAKMSSAMGEPMNANGALTKVGGSLDWFQIQLCLIFALQWTGIRAFVGFLPFIQKQPSFICDSTPEGELPQVSNFYSCSEQEACASGKYQFDLVEGASTWITDFGLVCDRRYLIGILGSTMFFGSLIGSYIGGSFSDRIGRRATHKLAIIATFVSLVMILVSNSVPMLLLAVFIFGTLHHIANLVSMVLFAECFNDENGHWGTTLCNSLLGAGGILAAVISIYINNWQRMVFLPLLQIFIVLARIPFIPESPRFLILKGKFKEARIELNKIAEVNGNPPFEDAIQGEFKDVEIVEEEESLIQTDKAEATANKSYSLLELLSFKSVRGKLLICFVLYFTTGLCYYGILYLTPSITKDPEDVYLNAILLGLVEFVSINISGYLTGRFGRRLTCVVHFAIGAVGFLVFQQSESSFWLIVSICTGKYAVSAANNMLFIYCAELFPTVIKNTATGLCSLISKLGGVVAPSLVIMSKSIGVSSVTIFAVLCAFATVLTCVLPETKGRPLQDKIEEDQPKKDLIDQKMPEF